MLRSFEANSLFQKTVPRQKATVVRIGPKQMYVEEFLAKHNKIDKNVPFLDGEIPIQIGDFDLYQSF